MDHAPTIAAGSRRRNGSSIFVGPLFDIYQGLLTTENIYPAIRAFLLADGYAAAWGKLVAAVLVNHLRRFAIPWLLQPLFGNALETMKVARSSPYFLLEETLRVPLSRVVVWAVVQTVYWYAWTGLHSFCLSFEILVARRDATKRALKDKIVGDVCMVLLLASAVMYAEYIYSETAWAVSMLVAAANVVLYGEVEGRRMLVRLPMESGGALFIAMFLLALVRFRLGKWWEMLGPREGRMPLILYVFVGGVGYATYHLVRYSNYYFIVLEMRDMLITWLWLVLATATAVYWKLNGSTPDLEDATSKLE